MNSELLKGLAIPTSREGITLQFETVGTLNMQFNVELLLAHPALKAHLGVIQFRSSSLEWEFIQLSPTFITGEELVNIADFVLRLNDET